MSPPVVWPTASAKQFPEGKHVSYCNQEGRQSLEYFHFCYSATFCRKMLYFDSTTPI